jgi:hypothetical protein
MCHVSGGPKPEVLYEAQVPVFDHRVCNDIFNLAGLDEKLTDTFICAGVKEGGTDACEVSREHNQMPQTPQQS